MIMKRQRDLGLRQLSHEEQDELDDRLNLLLTLGKQTEGTSPMVDITKRPDYFDEEKANLAQKTVNKYYLGLAMSSTVGLMLLLQLEEILIPLLRTGKSRTVPDLYDRYSATAKYIKCCYESRFYDPTSTGWVYVNMIRSMHQRIYKIMNFDEKNRALIPEREKDKSQYKWVNQYDMAMTQFAFVGAFTLRPDKCGASDISVDELSRTIYFWRLLSYQLGVEERFNLFVYHEDIAKQARFLEMIYNLYKDRLAEPRNQVGVEMGAGFLLAFENLTKDATINIVEHHWFDVISITGKLEPTPYEGIGELLKLARFKIIMKLTSSNNFIRRIMVEQYKKKLDKFCSNGEKERKKLEKKYPNQVYELV